MVDFIVKILMIIIPVLLDQLKRVLTSEQFIKYADRLLDWCERAIEAQEDWYDEYLLELVKIVREMASIPDLPDEEPVA